MNYKTSFRSIRDDVSAEEWQARVDLAACYRLIDRYGMTDLIYNHITARVPGTEHHLLINLYGLLYKEITASSLVKIDLDGDIVWKPDTDYDINKSGYVIHGASIAPATTSPASCTRTPAPAWRSRRWSAGLLPLTQTSIRFVGHIGYHDYEGPATELDERARLVRDLGAARRHGAQNHGLLTCGADHPARRSTLMYQLEMSCRAQVDAMAARTELTYPRKKYSRRPRTCTSPARAAPTACWNGRRCYGCSPPRPAAPATRLTGSRRYSADCISCSRLTVRWKSAEFSPSPKSASGGASADTTSLMRSS